MNLDQIFSKQGYLAGDALIACKKLFVSCVPAEIKKTNHVNVYTENINNAIFTSKKIHAYHSTFS